MQAACASFAFALITGMQYVATGCSRRVLVVGADCNSRIINPADPQTYPLFGDAAGAVLLGPGSERQGILAYAVGSDGSGAGLLNRPMGGSREPFSADPASRSRQYLHMEGRPVFKWAIRMLEETTADVLRTAGMSIEQINLVVFHQANLRIISAAAEELGLQPAQDLHQRRSFRQHLVGQHPPGPGRGLPVGPHSARRPCPVQRLWGRAGLGNRTDALVSVLEGDSPIFVGRKLGQSPVNVRSPLPPGEG